MEIKQPEFEHGMSVSDLVVFGNSIPGGNTITRECMALIDYYYPLRAVPPAFCMPFDGTAAGFEIPRQAAASRPELPGLAAAWRHNGGLWVVPALIRAVFSQTLMLPYVDDIVPARCRRAVAARRTYDLDQADEYVVANVIYGICASLLGILEREADSCGRLRIVHRVTGWAVETYAGVLYMPRVAAAAAPAFTANVADHEMHNVSSMCT